MKNKKHFLGINWMIRWLNPQFVFSILKSFVVSLITYTGLTETDIGTWPAFWAAIIGVMSNPVMLLNMADAMYNAIIDFTTKGLQDSNLTKNKTRATDPNMPVEMIGDDEVNDETEIIANNTETTNAPPKSNAEEF